MTKYLASLLVLMSVSSMALASDSTLLENKKYEMPAYNSNYASKNQQEIAAKNTSTQASKSITDIAQDAFSGGVNGGAGGIIEDDFKLQDYKENYHSDGKVSTTTINIYEGNREKESLDMKK